MVYERVQKNSSSWSPAFHQDKSESLFKPRPFSIQPEADMEDSEKQEIPAYSRADRDAISAKLLNTMGANVQSQAETESQKPESESEELDSEEMSNETETLQRTSESGEAGDDDDNSPHRGAIQRHVDNSESELHSQGIEAEESDEEMSLEAGAIQRQSESEDPEDDVKSVQTKLTVGAPGDKYEQEADSVAAQVMSMSVQPAPSMPIQRQGEEEEQEPLVQRSSLADSITPLVQRLREEQEEPLQAKSLLQRAGNGSAEAGTNVESQLNQSKGGGSPLPNEVRSFMEPRFGADFSQVRVHTDSTAVQMNKELSAQAFAHGSDIYYGAGKSPGNNELTAHELTHVVQQTGGVRLNKALQRQPLEEEREEAKETPVSAKELSSLNSAEMPNKMLQQQAKHEQQEEEETKATQVQTKKLPDMQLPLTLNKIQRQTEPEQGQEEEVVLTPVQAKALPGVNPLLTLNRIQRQPELESEQERWEEETDAKPFAAKELSENALGGINKLPQQQLEMGQVEGETEATSIQAKALPDFSGQFSEKFGKSHKQSDGKVTDDAFVSDLPDLSGNAEIPNFADASVAMPGQMQTEIPDAKTTRVSLAAEPGVSTHLPDTNFIQRSEDEGGGLLGGARQLISGIVDGLRSGWGSLTQMAQGAFEGLRGQFTSIAQGLGSLVTSALSGIQSGWTTLSQMATQLTNGIQQQLQGAIGTITGAVSAIGQAIVNMDAAALKAAFGRVTGLIGGVFQQLQQAGQAVFERISNLWNGLQSRFNDVLGNLANRASQIFTQLQTAAEGVRQRLTSVWDALQNRASQMSGVLGGVLERLRSLVTRVLSWGQQIWNGIQQQWTALRGRLDRFLQGVRQQITNALQALRQRAMAMWQQITGLWNRLSQWVRQQIQRLTNGVRSIWTSLQGLSITNLVEKISGLSHVYRLIQELATNIRGYAEPMAQNATNRAFAAMPGSALGYAQEQMGRAGGRSTATSTRAATSGDTLIQRTPLSATRSTRSTASFEEIGNGFETAIRLMWQNLTWSAFFDMLLNALLEQLFPPLAVYRQLRDFVTEDLVHMVSGLYAPRNVLTDPLGALHDIYTNLLHLVSDFVLALLRRLANILMSFQLWITIILTSLGAVGGATVVGILGAIFAGLATLGIGAGAGAAGGAAAGGAAGAGVGFGLSLLVGEAIFFGLLGVHGATILELLLDLSTALQTDEEKRRDYTQLAESAITVGVGLALLLLGWLAGVAAKGIGPLLKGIKIELPPAVSRFLRGVGSVSKPRPGATPASEVGAALAAEQRLATQVGGALARRLVAELGPELAEQIVARLGPETASRLGAELTSREMATIAASGLRPSAINAALDAGQARRLAGLSSEQLNRFAALSDTGFGRIISLPEGQFQRFASLGEAQLRAFAEMEGTAFNRFATLDENLFSRFRAMSPDKIEAFGRLSESAFNRYTALDPATFAKFERLSPEAVERFGSLNDAAFTRFAALDQAVLEKFSNIPTPALNRFGTMDTVRFNLFVQAQQATIEKFAALSDTAFNRFAGINYTVAELDKLGRLDPAVLENLATVPNQGHVIFLTKRLDEAALANIGQLLAPEIDSLLTRIGTNPARLNTLGSLSLPELRKFLAISNDALLVRFANLSPTELANFRALSTAELERFAQVEAANLQKFASLGNPAALRQFATLSPEQIATLGRLNNAQLNVWAGVQQSTLAQFAARDALTLGKLADGAGVAGIERLASMPSGFVQEFALLDTAAMQRYLSLPPGDLAKFNGMTGFNMQQLANRPPGELEALAATRTAAELLAEAGDTPAERAANRAAVLALDDPTINPATGRPRGHASEHSAGSNQALLGGGMSPIERRLRTGVTTGGVAGPRPPEVSVFASEAVQLEAVRLGRTNLQAEIAAGRPIGTGPGGRHTFATIEGTAPSLEGAGYSYRIEGATVDPATGNLVGGNMVQRQVSGFRIVFEPTTPTPTSPADYRIVTMFPE
jgi:phage-related protein